MLWINNCKKVPWNSLAEHSKYTSPNCVASSWPTLGDTLRLLSSRSVLFAINTPISLPDPDLLLLMNTDMKQRNCWIRGFECNIKSYFRKTYPSFSLALLGLFSSFVGFSFLLLVTISTHWKVINRWFNNSNINNSKTKFYF